MVAADEAASRHLVPRRAAPRTTDAVLRAKLGATAHVPDRARAVRLREDLCDEVKDDAVEWVGCVERRPLGLEPRLLGGEAPRLFFAPLALGLEARRPRGGTFPCPKLLRRGLGRDLRLERLARSPWLGRDPIPVTVARRREDERAAKTKAEREGPHQGAGLHASGEPVQFWPLPPPRKSSRVGLPRPPPDASCAGPLGAQSTETSSRVSSSHIQRTAFVASKPMP